MHQTWPTLWEWAQAKLSCWRAACVLAAGKSLAPHQSVKQIFMLSFKKKKSKPLKHERGKNHWFHLRKQRPWMPSVCLKDATALLNEPQWYLNRRLYCKKKIKKWCVNLCLRKVVITYFKCAVIKEFRLNELNLVSQGAVRVSVIRSWCFTVLWVTDTLETAHIHMTVFMLDNNVNIIAGSRRLHRPVVLHFHAPVSSIRKATLRPLQKCSIFKSKNYEIKKSLHKDSEVTM